MDALLSKLAEQGVVAIILAISILGNWLLFKLLREVWEARLKDAKENQDNIMQPLKAIQETVKLILDGKYKR